MTNRRRLALAVILAVIAARVLACASNSPTNPTTSVSAIAVTGTSSFNIGQAAQLTATATMSNGTTQNVTSSATWTSSNGTVLTVSGSGFVTANSIGDVDVKATYQGIAAALHVTVSAQRDAGAPTPAPPSPSPTPTPTPAPAPTPTPAPTGLSCGVERWAVKTLSDADAARVSFSTVTSTTISALNNFAAHCSGLPDARTFAEEFRVYEVTALVQLTRNEGDRDVHIALADPTDQTQTIVVEVIDPACAGAARSPYAPTLVQARAQYQSLGALTGQTVRVRGVGFYDFAHGQTGRSRSCIELHPVIGISR